MTYVLTDSIAVLDEFASIGGLADFRAWAETQAEPLRLLVEFGYSEDLQEIARLCKEATPPKAVAEQVRILGEAAARAHDILIIHDGMMHPGVIDHEEPNG